MMKKLAFLFLAMLPTLIHAQTDDFNDGTDQPEWSRYNPIGVATFSLPNGGYRIQTGPSPGAQFGPARAGSLRPQVTYSDFYITVDIVNWNTNLNQAFGILARVNDVGPGRTDGYAMTWDRGGRDLDISWFTNEVPAGVPVTGGDVAPLESGKAYRMVFKGVGTQLTGEIYELPNLRTPLASITGTDDRIPSGVAGMIVYDNASQANWAGTDTTFDNYFATDVEPPRLEIDVLPFQEVRVSWPANTTHVLQFTDQLGTAWTDITTGIREDIPGRKYVDHGQETIRFYRLRPETP